MGETSIVEEPVDKSQSLNPWIYMRGKPRVTIQQIVDADAARWVRRFLRSEDSIDPVLANRGEMLETTGE